jgi:hypothetical protein
VTDYYTHKQADNYRVTMSKTILTPTAATYNIIRIPRYALLMDVWLLVNVVGSSNAVSLGWAGNGETAQTAGFMSYDIADVLTLGLKRAMRDTLIAFEGKYFDYAGGIITITGGTTQTTGNFIAFCTYSIIK